MTSGKRKRQRIRITVELTPRDKELLAAITAARALDTSSAVRELIREADPQPPAGASEEQPSVATHEELLEMLTTLARGGDRQAIKDLARLLPKPEPGPPADGEEPQDPAERYRRMIKGGGLSVVEDARA